MESQLSTLINDEELKIRVAHELDVSEFMDACDISFAELIDIVFDELDEEQKENLIRTIAN